MKNDESKKSLEHVTFDELVEEMGRRCSSLVVGAVMLGESKDEPGVRLRFLGNRIECRGMVAELQDRAADASASMSEQDRDE